MTEPEMNSLVMNLVRKEVGIPDLQIDPDGDIRQQVNLDSMQFVSILARIEDEFGVELPIEILTVNTFRDFLSILKQTVPLQPV